MLDVYAKTHGIPKEDSSRFIMYFASNYHFKVQHHREQHELAVQWSETAEAASEAREQRRSWQRDTFCALWSVSGVRALGFLVREACSRSV